jgi:tRNA-specific 2-thiouridylase
MKVAVAMSGGVDSSVAMGLLKEQGHAVLGLTLKILPCELTPQRATEPSLTVLPSKQRCCSMQDIQDAREVALSLGAPHYVCDGLDTFRLKVVDRFLDDYAHGITPNPCVECNRFAKIPLLLKQSLELGCEKMATGHYARIDYDSQTGRYRLKKSVDDEKDQSYVLYKLSQKLLSFLLFPLGDLHKQEVRQKAHQLQLGVAEKKDSMEICFVTEGSYRDFVKAHRPEAFKPGFIRDQQGTILGEHQGVAGFTLGQRKGLGLSHGPYFVLKLEPDTATVIVGKENETWHQEFIVTELNWVAWEKLLKPQECMVKIRYRSDEQLAVLYPELDDRQVRVVFKNPVKAITPGQSAVFYDNDYVAGGGIIERVLAKKHEALVK